MNQKGLVSNLFAKSFENAIPAVIPAFSVYWRHTKVYITNNELYENTMDEHINGTYSSSRF
jgi:hypothetical protein